MNEPTRLAAPLVLLAACVALAGCHTRSRITTTRPGATRTQLVAGGEARALPATAAISDDGALRFVTPLRCPADLMVEVETLDSVKVEASVATFVVGVIVTALGAVSLARGAVGDDPASSGWTYLGGGGLAAGLTFAIGPWIGNGTTEVPTGTSSMRKGAAEAPCGDRAVIAESAKVRIGRFEATGAVDADGRFAISPFAFVDAFAIGELPALDISAQLLADNGTTSTIEAVIEASDLVGAAVGYLAATKVDATRQELRKIPTLEADGIRVSRLSIDGQRVLRVVVPLINRGPGDAWQVRAIVSAEQPEVDGRIIYVGHLAPGEQVTAELLAPLSGFADAELAGAEIDLMIQIRAADGTGPAAPARFHGRVLNDINR